MNWEEKWYPRILRVICFYIDITGLGCNKSDKSQCIMMHQLNMACICNVPILFCLVGGSTVHSNSTPPPIRIKPAPLTPFMNNCKWYKIHRKMTNRNILHSRIYLLNTNFWDRNISRFIPTPFLQQIRWLLHFKNSFK